MAGGELKNSDLALPEGSIAKRRGAKVMMRIMMVMKRKEAQYGGRPDEPQLGWCVKGTFSSFPNTLVTSLHSASPLALGPPYHTQSLLRRLNNRLCLHPRRQVRRSK